MRTLRLINLASAIHFIINGRTEQVQILGLMLLPLVLISILYRPKESKKDV